MKRRAGLAELGGEICQGRAGRARAIFQQRKIGGGGSRGEIGRGEQGANTARAPELGARAAVGAQQRRAGRRGPRRQMREDRSGEHGWQIGRKGRGRAQRVRPAAGAQQIGCGGGRLKRYDRAIRGIARPQRGGKGGAPTRGRAAAARAGSWLKRQHERQLKPGALCNKAQQIALGQGCAGQIELAPGGDMVRKRHRRNDRGCAQLPGAQQRHAPRSAWKCAIVDRGGFQPAGRLCS